MHWSCHMVAWLIVCHLVQYQFREYLLKIAESYNGGPVGVDTLSAALADQRDVIEEVIEPYLIQQGYVHRTSRGRVLSKQGWVYLDLPIPDEFIDDKNI